MTQSLIGITSSPNTPQQVAFIFAHDCMERGLKGSLVTFRMSSINESGVKEDLLVVAQIGDEVVMSNPWMTKDPVINMAANKPQYLPRDLCADADSASGVLYVLGAYKMTPEGYEKTLLRSAPHSGLPITLIDHEQITHILAKEPHYALIGSIFGTSHVPAPIALQHFGPYAEGGTGEGYMGGVFGPSGSGKTVMALMLVAAWTMTSPNMGFLLLDPQSEFAENRVGGNTRFHFDLHKLLHTMSGGRFQPARDIVHLDEIQLEGEELFAQLLHEVGFFKKIVRGAAKMPEVLTAFREFLEFLDGRSDQNTGTRWFLGMDYDSVMKFTITVHDKERTVKDTLVEEIAQVYAFKDRSKHAESIVSSLERSHAVLRAHWNKIASLFAPQDDQGRSRQKLLDIVDAPLTKGRITILDLNPERINLHDDQKLAIMQLVIRRLRQYGHIHFKNGKGRANCLIVMDEAGLFVPQNPEDNEGLRHLTRTIVDSVRTLRKYQMGFLFITQGISSIDKEIYRNLHYRIYGPGLNVGADKEHILNKEGRDALNIYEGLPDPRRSGIFTFMMTGNLPILGTSNRPLFVQAYASSEEFWEANRPALAHDLKVAQA